MILFLGRFVVVITVGGRLRGVEGRLGGVEGRLKNVEGKLVYIFSCREALFGRV